MSGSGCSDLSETNTKGEGATEALKPRRYARGEFQCPPPDDTVPAPKPGECFLSIRSDQKYHQELNIPMICFCTSRSRDMASLRT